MEAREVIDLLESMRDEKQRRILMRFFKTGEGQYGHGDEFLGIKMPRVHEVVAAAQDLPLEEVPQLLTNRWHEVRMCGFLILVERFGKLCRKSTAGAYSSIDLRDRILQMYLAHAEYANNWDLVDLSAPKILGAWVLLPTFLGGGEEPALNYEYKWALLDRLAASGCLWEQRMSMVFSWKTTQAGMSEWCLRYADIHLHHPHDLMHKAVGWMLREVGKRCGKEILFAFLGGDDPSADAALCTDGSLARPCRAATMPRTALRYAIEKLDPAERQYWMTRQGGGLPCRGN